MFGTKKNKEADFITTAEPLKLTTIATGTVLKGIIEVEGSLRVDGVIEGDVTCHKMVVIGPQGTVKGDIHVTDLLTLKAGCLMNGDIYTCKLEIEPQARFNGTCNTIEEQQLQTKAAE